jgi:hypothetical protein
MNRQLLLVLVAWFVIGSCISARAAEPNVGNTKPVIVTAIEAADRNANNTGNSGSNTYTGGTTVTAGTLVLANVAAPADNQFAGKIVLVNMTQGTSKEVFMLENVKFQFGSETFLVGTGIKNDSDPKSFCEGFEVHLRFRLVTSYIVMTPEQWKEKQRSARTPPVGITPPSPQPQTVPVPGQPQPQTVPVPVQPQPQAIPVPGQPQPQTVPVPVEPQSAVPVPEQPQPAAVSYPVLIRPAVVSDYQLTSSTTSLPLVPTQQASQDKHGWEYKVVTFTVDEGDDAQTKEINWLVADGWEYVGLLSAGANRHMIGGVPASEVTSSGHVLFKRHKR